MVGFVAGYAVVVLVAYLDRRALINGFKKERKGLKELANHSFKMGKELGFSQGKKEAK